MRVACVDVGSTDTKCAVVDTATGALVATLSGPTTLGTDVLAGVDALLAAAGPVGGVYCCSSAGGGLRLAVVGFEALVSADAAARVALTAGARVVGRFAGRLDGPAVRALRDTKPDVVLLAGGTDGGDGDTIRHNAARLATARWKVPVVVAGNRDARDEIVALLGGRGLPVAAAGNVLPRIGVIEPGPARAAIRELFLRHVIGGKRLSRGPRFGRLVSAATPDAVLTGVGVLARVAGGDLLVVDVGGATTDVYSALRPGETAADAVAGVLWQARTVEGDLGVRWNRAGIVEAAARERVPVGAGFAGLESPGLASPGFASGGLVSSDGAGGGGGLDLATAAVTVALRRHARTGRDLRDVVSVIASGGVFRHAEPAAARAAVRAALDDHAGGWALPRDPAITVDRDYILAAAGLLAADHPDAAAALCRALAHAQ
ncbi:glutamate mutase L [Dactylosporangium sp. NPDC051541]|uniref:glutamate mutase L n=1 Tax=Dactylosporangium sp. NPDC051541 TaxID=3363977 RepID=UPI0037B9824B